MFLGTSNVGSEWATGAWQKQGNAAATGSTAYQNGRKQRILWQLAGEVTTWHQYGAYRQEWMTATASEQIYPLRKGKSYSYSYTDSASATQTGTGTQIQAADRQNTFRTLLDTGTTESASIATEANHNNLKTEKYDVTKTSASFTWPTGIRVASSGFV